MRVLLYPTFSYPGNVGADSLWIIARNLVEANPEIGFYVVEPDSGTPDVDLPNYHPVRVPLPQLYRRQEAVPNEDVIWRFAPQDGLDPVEAVITMSPHRMVNVKNAWTIRMPEEACPIFVNWDLLVRDDTKGEITANDADLLQMAAGVAMGDMNVHESPVARDMTLNVVKRFLAPSQVRHVMNHSELVYQGIPVDRLLQTIEGVEKREKFTVYYGGRLSESKRFDHIAEVVRRLYEFGREVEFVVTTGSISGQKLGPLQEKYPWLEIHVGKSQEEAWRIMASCHASLCFSQHELFGMAFWEQMAAGLAVVMKAERWNKELVPPGYTWIAQTTTEAAAMIREAYDLWESGETIKGGAEYVRENYDSGQNLRQMGDRIQQVVLARRARQFLRFEKGQAATVIELATKAMEEVDTISMTELVKRMRDLSDIGTNVIGKKMIWGRSNSVMDVYRGMLWLGYVDDVARPEITFRKLDPSREEE